METARILYLSSFIILCMMPLVSAEIVTPYEETVCKDQWCTSIVHEKPMYIMQEGNYTDINPLLVPYNQDGYDYRTNLTPYSLYVKANSNWGDGVKYCKTHNGTEYCLVYQSSDMSYRNEFGSQDYISSIQNSQGVVSGTTITYPNTYPGVDLGVTAKNGEIKQDYVVQTPTRSPAGWLSGSISLDFGGYIKFDGLTMQNEQGSTLSGDFVMGEKIYFVAPDGTRLFYLPEPVGFDAEGKSTRLLYEVDDRGSQIWFYTKTPLEWLQNASYPVHIDPSVSEPQGINTTTLSIQSWEGESNFSITYEGTENIITGIQENRSFFDLLVESPLQSNTLSFKINEDNLRWSYQGRLDDEHNDYENCNATNCFFAPDEYIYRPKNVVGSYAVYHSTKKNNEYTTGKIFHLYRPLIIDSNGTIFYGNLSYSNGTLEIVIPEEYFSNLEYPVYIDPTFGNTNVGGTAWTSTSYSLAFRTADVATFGYTAVSGDEVTTFHVYQGSTGRTVQMALYSTTSGLVDAKVSTNTDNIVSTGAGWFTDSHTVSLTAGTEYVVAVGGWSGGADMRYDSNAVNVLSRSTDSGALTDPFNPSSVRVYEISMYVTYENNAGGDTCTATSQTTHQYDCSDNCVVNHIDFGGSRVNASGTGTLTFQSNVTNIGSLYLQNTCSLRINNNIQALFN